MAKLVIYGYSDDLVETDGVFEEEFQAIKGVRLLVLTPDDKVISELTANYTSHEWEFEINHLGLTPRIYIDADHCEYSPTIEFDVPEGTTVVEK